MHSMQMRCRPWGTEEAWKRERGENGRNSRSFERRQAFEWAVVGDRSRRGKVRHADAEIIG